jgi:uncharacterized cupin superfamily protein
MEFTANVVIRPYIEEFARFSVKCEDKVVGYYFVRAGDFVALNTNGEVLTVKVLEGRLEMIQCYSEKNILVREGDSVSIKEGAGA